MSEQQPAAPHCYNHPKRETWIRCQRCERPICPDCMVHAAVGFQCPSCVAQGRKDTRSGLLRFGGKKVAEAYLTTGILIAINVGVWLAIMVDHGWKGSLADKLSLIPRGVCQLGADRYYPDMGHHTCSMISSTHWVDGVASGAYWQPLTSMFTHVEFWHIGVNMLSLFFLGPVLEQIVGRARYLATYFVSGLVGSAAVMLFSNPAGPTGGASGAIFGVMGALLVIGIRAKFNMQQLWIWLALNLVFTFTANNISWEGHLGGLVGGAACAAVIAYAPRVRRTQVQAAGLTGVLAIAIVVTALRAAALG